MNPQFVRVIYYPESDGRPIGESDLHIHWTIQIRNMLKRRYRGQRVYVASNLLVYYEEGFPQYVVVPDVFVVKDSDPGFRRVYKVWEEGPPHFVLEVTSASTRREDEERKPNKYMQFGVREYFLYDPSGEYLRPALKGCRLAGDDYVPIESDKESRLSSEELGIWLRVEDSSLVLYDSATGERLLTADEAEMAKEIALDAAVAEAEAAKTAAKEAEKENRRLQEELRRLRNSE